MKLEREQSQPPPLGYQFYLYNDTSHGDQDGFESQNYSLWSRSRVPASVSTMLGQVRAAIARGIMQLALYRRAEFQSISRRKTMPERTQMMGLALKPLSGTFRAFHSILRLQTTEKRRDKTTKHAVQHCARVAYQHECSGTCMQPAVCASAVILLPNVLLIYGMRRQFFPPWHLPLSCVPPLVNSILHLYIPGSTRVRA